MPSPSPRFALLWIPVALATLATAANAADWKPIENIDNDQWRAFDASRTKLVKPGIVSTWKRYSVAQLAEKYPGYEYSVTEWEIDCTLNQQRILSSFDYDAKGKIVNTDIWKDSQFRPIPPDSKGDAEATAICDRVIKKRR